MIMTLLGLVGAVLSASIALPQAVRAVRVGTAGVSSTTYQLACGLGVTWCAYGVFEQLWLFAIGNGILGACSAVVLFSLQRNGDAAWDTTKLILGVFVVAVIVGSIEVTWLGWFAGLLSVALRAPQMRLVRSAASIHGVSVNTWVVSLVANVTWLIYGALASDTRLLVTCSVNTVFSTSLIIGIVARRRVLAERAVPGNDMAVIRAD